MDKSIESTTNKAMDIVKGIVLTAIPVCVGLVVYNLFLDKPVQNLKAKITKS